MRALDYSTMYTITVALLIPFILFKLMGKDSYANVFGFVSVSSLLLGIYKFIYPDTSKEIPIAQLFCPTYQEVCTNADIKLNDSNDEFYRKKHAYDERLRSGIVYECTEFAINSSGSDHVKRLELKGQCIERKASPIIRRYIDKGYSI